MRDTQGKCPRQDTQGRRVGGLCPEASLRLDCLGAPAVWSHAYRKLAALATVHAGGIDSRIAAMQHCVMSYTLPISKRGSLTIPPALRRKLGIDKVPEPLVVLTEREGGLFIQFAAAVPVRDIPRSVIEGWVREDRAQAPAFGKPRKAARRAKRM